MKPKEYVSSLSMQGGKFDHSKFISSFSEDFNALLNTHHPVNKTKFYNSVKEIRQKWDGISTKVTGGLPPRLWNFFYATVVISLRDKLLGEDV